MKKVVALIPARMGSKRLLDKNFRNFCGKTLTDWAILTALKCKLIDQVIVSTDNYEYSYDHPKVIIDYRDPEMCGYDIHTDDIFLYLQEKYGLLENIKILLLPTQPLRTPKLLNKGIKLHLKTNKTIVSVYKHNWNPNGIYIIYNTKGVYDSEVIPVPMNSKRGIDIDFLYQFRIAEYLFKKMKMPKRLCN